MLTAGDSISVFSTVVKPPRADTPRTDRRTSEAASSFAKASPGKFAASADPAEMERRMDVLERAQDERGARQGVEEIN